MVLRVPKSTWIILGEHTDQGTLFICLKSTLLVFPNLEISVYSLPGLQTFPSEYGFIRKTWQWGFGCFLHEVVNLHSVQGQPTSCGVCRLPSSLSSLPSL